MLNIEEIWDKYKIVDSDSGAEYMTESNFTDAIAALRNQFEGARGFIIQEINKLEAKYNSLKCTYSVDTFSKSHFVKIHPKEFYQSNDDFLQDELKIVSEFLERFPYESLTFITEDDEELLENGVIQNTKIAKSFFLKLE